MLQRDWEFRVAVSVNPGECVCVVGDCSLLGNWYHTSALFLERESNTDSVDGVDSISEPVWTGKTSLPIDCVVEYRYMICFVLEPTPSHPKREIIVRRWETNVKPRHIPGTSYYNPESKCPPDVFGTYGGETHVDRGWLTCETAVQLKFFMDPIQMWRRTYKDKQFRIKVTPVEIASDPGSELASLCLDESLDVHELRAGTKSWPIVEVAAMNEADCSFKLQGQFGRPYQPGECVVFQTYVLNPGAMAFLIDIYVHDNCGNEDGGIPEHAGFCYLLQSNMPESEGRAVLPLTSAKHQPIGQLKVEYVVVKPIQDYKCDTSMSYAKHWKHSWRGLEVGHRGAGSSFKEAYKSCANIRENTIASLAYAASHGADIVELDVQLSKDLVPVIYHDFHICIAMKRKRRTAHEEHDLLQLPVKDLTLEQLHMLKDEQHKVSQRSKPSKVLAFCEDAESGDADAKEVYHVNEGNNNKNFTEADDDDEDHQPFPTLQHALERLDPHVGFNVEIKWTMQLKDGTYELYHPFEVNMYLDTMLKALLNYGGSRKIVISCFHPDICTMLRLKQNKYPVLFLTQGVTQKYPAYHDPRTHNIPMGISFALSADILGINVHTEDLLRDPSQVALVHRSNLILFCWGEDNNDQQVIRYLKELGLDGIIYDKIDVYSLKETKESIFLVEAREARKELLEVASHPSPGLPPPGLVPPTPAMAVENGSR